MLVLEFAAANRPRGINASEFAILATDISQSVMEKAIRGEYSQAEISRGLSEERRKKHSMVEYRLLNLTGSHGHLGKFDVIFCRNVLIYFDVLTSNRILGQFQQMLNPSGLLILGASETINAKAMGLETVHFGMTCAYRNNSAKPAGLATPGADRGKTPIFASATPQTCRPVR
jgi:chemotaxis protein methyltransferase CheR